VIAVTVAHKGGTYLDASTRRWARSVTQFVQAPAIVARSRSVWHEIIETVMEGPPRTAADGNRRISCRTSVRFITDVAD
jgi:hypothetical protein